MLSKMPVVVQYIMHEKSVFKSVGFRTDKVKLDDTMSHDAAHYVTNNERPHECAGVRSFEHLKLDYDLKFGLLRVSTSGSGTQVRSL